MSGIAKVGRLTLTELDRRSSEKSNASTGVRSITLDGQESHPPSSVAEVRQRHADVSAHPDSLVPVILSDKVGLNGYYTVSDTGSVIEDWPDEPMHTADWSMTLTRVGSEHEVDMESRLSGPQSRGNDFTVTGERLHAPPIGHYAYAAGAAVPTVVTRTGSDGAMSVYRGLQVGTHPRWGCAPADYLKGRVRFIDSDGLERSGVDIPLNPLGWTLHNGLVRVTPSAGLLDVAAWSNGAWRSKTWQVRVSGSPLGDPVSVTLLRNEPEMVVLRLIWAVPTQGRVEAELTLRRGQRVLEAYITTQSAVTIRVQRGTSETGIQPASQGYLQASVNDADGNRYVIGSARTASVDTATGALFKANTRTLGLYLGAAVGGAGAAPGDTPADLQAQYVGMASERVAGVRR